jgi:hypothetical protein
MKKNYFIGLALVLSGLLSTSAMAQCLVGTNFGAATANGTVASYQTITTCAFAGERSSLTVNFLCALFSFNATGGSSNYLTITNAGNVVIAAGVPPITNIQLPATGQYWIHVTTNGPPTCGTESQCRTVSWMATSLPACSGSPASADAIASNTSVCPGSGVDLSLSTSYSATCGYTFQWQASTTGTAGVYSNLATGAAVNSGPLSATTAFRAIITCTNGPASTTSTPVEVVVGLPDVSQTISSPMLLCPGETASLSLSSKYTGVSYQWQYATQSNVGPYFNEPGTTFTYNATNVTSPTYYQAIITCTSNATSSITTLPVFVNVESLVIDSVPYLENFEGVQLNNKLPNCSWSRSSSANANTFMSAGSFNRIPASGAKFAAFKGNTGAGGAYFYSNGIQLFAGVVYTASLNYIADGLQGWSELSMHYNTSQSATGLTQIATAGSTILNTFYKVLGNTFSVPTSGIYYIAVKGVGASTAQYLTWDDLAIDIPCNLNTPTINIAASNTICAGESFVATASGADSYSWSTGATGPVLNTGLFGNTSLFVTGTNTITGCSATVYHNVQVYNTPVVSIVSSTSTVCAGKPVQLTATGANTYLWAHNSTLASLMVNPTSNTVYQVIGQNQFGCEGQASITISVNPLPNVNASSNVLTSSCHNDPVTLTATGAFFYLWTAPFLYNSQNPITLQPPVGMHTFTVTGTDANGCVNSAMVSLLVEICSGISESSAPWDLRVFPNPGSGILNVIIDNGAEKTITMHDALGRVVKNTLSSEAHTQINISDLNPGLYYMHVKCGHDSKVIKVIRQ